MTATSHAILGTIIAAKISNPYLAIPLTIASHIAADFIPHWDTATNRRKKSKHRTFIDSSLDVALGFILSYLILLFLFPQTNFQYALLLIILSQSPDWLTAPYYFFNIKFFRFAYNFQKIYDRDLDKPWGIINQVVIIFGTLLLAKVF